MKGHELVHTVYMEWRQLRTRRRCEAFRLYSTDVCFSNIFRKI